MKKVILSVLAVGLFVMSCGPSQADLQKQQMVADSIAAAATADSIAAAAAAAADTLQAKTDSVDAAVKALN